MLFSKFIWFKNNIYISLHHILKIHLITYILYKEYSFKIYILYVRPDALSLQMRNIIISLFSIIKFSY